MDPDNNYEHDIPLKVIKLDLHDLIVKEEITDLIMKNDRGALSKEDLLEYGQLVSGDSLSYGIGRELKETVEKIFKEQGMKPDESEHMKSAFKSLSLDSNPDDFMKEKNRSSHLVPFSNNHLAVKNQKEIGISRLTSGREEEGELQN